jgi:predicted Rossmann fold nucleotide-binding protein DprA/Smf involved in DNA uptake
MKMAKINPAPIQNFSRDQVPEYPVLQGIGNLELLRLPLTALFCSRKCPGDAILQAYDLAQELRAKATPVISGFHTPVEQDMLDILLKGHGPIVICPARGLEGMRIAAKFRQRLEEGTLLFCSVANPHAPRPKSYIAEERNRLVAALASEHIFVHVEPGGRLEGLFNEIEKKVGP